MRGRALRRGARRCARPPRAPARRTPRRRATGTRRRRARGSARSRTEHRARARSQPPSQSDRVPLAARRRRGAPPPRMRDEGAQHRALVAGNDLLELVTRTTGGLDVPRREHDLDESGQESRALELRSSVSASARGSPRRRRRCGPGRAAAGRGPAAAPTRSALASLYARSAPAKSPCKRRARPGGSGRARPPDSGLDEALARTTRLLERIPPLAVELEDLRPVHEAAPGEGDHLRLKRPPVRERPRPLARAPHLVDLLAREDHAAVDDPGDDRRQLLGRDRDHRLVEEREAVAHLTVPDQHVTLAVDREREEIAIAEALADRGPPPRRRRPPRRSPRRPRAGTSPGSSRYPRSAHSPSGSTSRWARPSQPLAGPISPRDARFRPIQAAQRTARSVSPASRWRRCARSSHATQSSSRPSMKAAVDEELEILGVERLLGVRALEARRAHAARLASRRPPGPARARRPDPARGAPLRAEPYRRNAARRAASRLSRPPSPPAPRRRARRGRSRPAG